jgi:phosphate transport system ATP-binding protein
MALAEPADPTSGTTQPAPTPRGNAVGRVEVTDLTATYRGRPAITGVNLAMEPGKVTALIGPSGCGKSTLLRCLNGLHMTVPGASVTGTVHLDVAGHSR